MTLYLALLRGVNVGNTAISMERVRGIFSAAGLEPARTYLQSGNVLFESGASPADLRQRIEQILHGETRLPVTVIIRSQKQMCRLVGINPFLKDPSVNASRLHVTFLSEAPPKRQLAALAAVKSGADRCVASGAHVFLHCPHGYGRTKLSNTAIERLLSLQATTRNWNTVKSLSTLPLH
jgi:uncharacterized protein (DUF1697 family)